MLQAPVQQRRPADTATVSSVPFYKFNLQEPLYKFDLKEQPSTYSSKPPDHALSIDPLALPGRRNFSCS